MKHTHLNFGTAGIPLSTAERTTIEGIQQVKKLGLDALELEFVHSVYVNASTAATIKQTVTKHDIFISSHSPYYLNLNAAEPAKLKRSIQLLSHSAIMTAACGGLSTAFHPAFYLKKTSKETYITVKKALQEVIALVQAAGHTIWIRPELTGKPTQFGNIQEIIQLSQELDMVLPCIDYAHYHARTGGKGNNTPEAFRKLLDDLEQGLGKTILNNMHIQIAGVTYTDKGERSHTNLTDSDLHWKEILQTWKDYNIKGVVIAETPNIEGDALLLKKTYHKL